MVVVFKLKVYCEIKDVKDVFLLGESLPGSCRGFCCKENPFHIYSFLPSTLHFTKKHTYFTWVLIVNLFYDIVYILKKSNSEHKYNFPLDKHLYTVFRLLKVFMCCSITITDLILCVLTPKGMCTNNYKALVATDDRLK